MVTIVTFIKSSINFMHAIYFSRLSNHAGTLTFLTQHESYEIGKMGFLKKYHTAEAMKYYYG